MLTTAIVIASWIAGYVVLRWVLQRSMARLRSEFKNYFFEAAYTKSWDGTYNFLVDRDVASLAVGDVLIKASLACRRDKAWCL